MLDQSQTPLLKTSDLTVSINNRILCKSLSVSMSAGESWSILGANGAGKTTLLTTLAGLLPTHSGSVAICGKELSLYNARKLALLRSILFQKSENAFPATVLETVMSGRHPHISYWQAETAADRDIALRCLEMVDLKGFEKRDINSLSGGERQRVSIAASLTQDTVIRLFDEPSNHLDLKHQNSILGLISNNDQRLNLFVLQDINQAWKYCSHAILIYPDGDVETGTVEDVLTLDKLEALYSCKLKLLQNDTDRVFIYAG